MTTHPIKFFEGIAGTLSKPSKMPGWGYGLPALTSCKTGSKLAQVPGTVCSTCYACKGHYQFAAVKEAQLKRMRSVSNPSWVEAMVHLIGSKREKFFRWHDSGDLLSVEHLSKICQIAVRLPEYKFWLPTQEQQIVREYVKQHGPVPDNLTIRISAPKIDGRPVSTDFCTSTVHKTQPAHGHICPAPEQGNKCGDCRACWDKGIKNVSYHAH